MPGDGRYLLQIFIFACLAAIIIIALIINIYKGRTVGRSAPLERQSETAALPVDERAKIGYKKKPFLSPSELRFFESLKELEKYVVIIPQVNLATVIQKTGDFKWQNGLYRNIDFGIFDRSYNLLLLIELNDPTHNNTTEDKEI